MPGGPLTGDPTPTDQRTETQITVLVVDDDRAMRELTTEWLERHRDVLTVVDEPNAAAGLERLETNRIDCVVSDYEMPAADGIEFLRQVRARDDSVPFVLYTGRGSEAVASEAIAAGVTAYVQKSSGSEHYELLANRICNAVAKTRAERRVEHERDRFRTLFDRLSQPVAEVAYVDETPIVRGVNEAFEQRFGYDADTVVGDSLDAYIVPEAYRTEAEAINEHVRSGGSLEARSVTRKTADGTREFLLQNAVYDDGTGGFAIYTDVTERRERRRTLERQRELFRRTQEIADVGAWQYDVETGASILTDEALAIHGLDPSADLTPEQSLDFYHPADRPEIREAFERAQEAGESYDLECRLIDADGDERWIRTRGDPQMDGDSVTRVRGTIQDVTERTRRQRALRRQNERLDRFVDTVSHDLRSPLNVARGRLGEIGDGHPAVADTAAFAAVERAHERMASLLTDMRRLARGGAPVVDPEPVVLSAVARESWRVVETADADLTVAIDDECTIRADESRLKQVFENLFRNAVEHGAPDVTVRVESHEGGFAVEDDGTGIPATDQESVLEPGYTTAEAGTGFGLRIVEAAVEAHGWSLDVLAGNDGGARIEVHDVECGASGG
ncbi:response regulator [Halorubrum sp. SY-15]|uniref:PAS domain-containing sensor histidine kinase n=1 Tax=Halorubrum sp. SY-15 TaxID=3402277 RepID=UPI003EB8C90D